MAILFLCASFAKLEMEPVSLVIDARKIRTLVRISPPPPSDLQISIGDCRFAGQEVHYD
jgi:hypothetical protein